MADEWSWGFLIDQERQGSPSPVAFYKGDRRLFELTDDPGRATRELIAKSPAMAVMLRRLEWAGYAGNGCPLCGASTKAGHRPDCDLATLLREIGP